MLGVYALGLFLVGFVQADPTITETSYVSDSVGPRIVGGWEADEGQFPFQVSIRMVSPVGSVFGCGGSVIHKNWVITAAHCTANRITYILRFGAAQLIRPTIIFEESSANNFLHPLYNPNINIVQRDDIALIKLSRDLTFGPTIQPIRLQSSGQKDFNYEGDILTVSGYGLTQDPWNGGAASSVLLWVYLRGISNTECRRWYLGVHPQTVCASYFNSTIQSACQGDSGGPLTVEDEDGKLTQIGIVSFGSTAGCSSLFPSAFVRPGYYHEWISSVTGTDFDWGNDPQPEEP